MQPPVHSWNAMVCYRWYEPMKLKMQGKNRERMGEREKTTPPKEEELMGTIDTECIEKTRPHPFLPSSRSFQHPTTWTFIITRRLFSSMKTTSWISGNSIVHPIPFGCPISWMCLSGVFHLWVKRVSLSFYTCMVVYTCVLIHFLSYRYDDCYSKHLQPWRALQWRTPQVFGWSIYYIQQRGNRSTSHCDQEQDHSCGQNVTCILHFAWKLGTSHGA